MNVAPRNFDPSISPSPETRGLEFYHSDRSLKALLRLYLAPAELRHMEPRLERRGQLVGGRLDDLARDADRTPPRLEPRNRLGEDRQSIAKAPAYLEMERMAFGDLALAAVSHRPALGWLAPPMVPRRVTADGASTCECRTNLQSVGIAPISTTRR